MSDFSGDGADAAGTARGPRAMARARERAEQRALEESAAPGAVASGTSMASGTVVDSEPVPAARPLPVSAPAAVAEPVADAAGSVGPVGSVASDPGEGAAPRPPRPRDRPRPPADVSARRPGERRPPRPGVRDNDRSGSGTGSGSGRTDSSSSGGFFGVLRELTIVIVIALGLSLIIKTFLVQAFFIPSSSMENTLQIGDRVLVSKLTPGPFDLHRGDIVVFKDPGGWLNTPAAAPKSKVGQGVTDVLTWVGLLPADSGEHLIKRVIGLPGDHVVCCDSGGRITVNGKPISESYLYTGNDPSSRDFDVTVPAGRLWVMGDHREVSEDSRYHLDEHDGTVSVEDDVVGRAFVIVWPFKRADVLSRPADVFRDVPAP